MEKSLIDLAKGYLTPDVIQKASALVGESPTSTQKALDMAPSALVAGLAGEASSPAGAQGLSRVIEDAGLCGPMSRITERLGAGSGEELISLGKDLLGRIFGPRIGPIADANAAASGVQPSSMRSLLGLAAPIVLGVIGNKMHTQKLDAAGLAGLLATEKDAAIAGLPSAPKSGDSVRPAARDVRAEAPRAEAASGGRRLWPLLLVVPAAILFGLVLRRGREPAATDASQQRGFGAGLGPQNAARIEAPRQDVPPVEVPRAGGGVQRFGPGTPVHDLAQFLTTPGDDSRRFVFDDIAFDSESARLTPSSLGTIAGIAAVLKAHPNAQILLEGHTDSTGAPATAQQLSLTRAEAVKSALVERGVDADRIATAGAGSDRPIASNDTPAGRAKNRRTELVVTER